MCLWLLSTVLLTEQAKAYDLATNHQKITLELGGWAQAGYTLLDEPGGDFSHGPYLGMARLSGAVLYKDLGSAFIQIEGNTESVELLDVIAELTPKKYLAIRAGRFRVPTSVDLQLGAPFTPFVNRGFLVSEGFVPNRRIGVELEGKAEVGTTKMSLRIGWFIPNPGLASILPEGKGNLLSARALVELNNGLSFHLAYAKVVGDNSPVGLPAIRPVRFDSHLDAAVIYKNDGWTGYIEAVLILDAPLGEALPFAAYAMLLKSFDIDNSEFDLEPGLRYDITREANIVSHRLTAGLTLYLVGDFLNTSLNYELLVTDGQVGHAGYAQLQAGF